MQIKLFLDGANPEEMQQACAKKLVKGFTTNPTLMRKAGVTNYKSFAQKAISIVANLPISFEVFSDTFTEMEQEAREIASWGKNVYVKIPIMNTQRQSAVPLIKKLSADGLPLNITAMMTLQQVKEVTQVISSHSPTIISVFAGRIADTGVDPVPMMSEAVKIIAHKPNMELLWASPRELLNIFQAEQCGCHIITATADLINKLSLVGKNLEDFSLETVKMFYNDARAAAFKIIELEIATQ